MNTSDLRKLSPNELEDRVREARQQLFDLRLQHTTGQLENSAQLATARRNLARALTVQNEGKQSA